MQGDCGAFFAENREKQAGASGEVVSAICDKPNSAASFARRRRKEAALC